MIPAGNYIARPINWLLSETKNGDEQAAVEMEITEEGDALGSTIIWTGTFGSDKAIEYTCKALRTMGWTGDRLDQITLASDADVRVVIEHETYEGTLRAKVKYINSLSGFGARKALDAGRQASFADRMRAKVAMIDARLGTPERPATRPTPRTPPARQPSTPVDPDGFPPPAADDTDIPF